MATSGFEYRAPIVREGEIYCPGLELPYNPEWLERYPDWVDRDGFVQIDRQARRFVWSLERREFCKNIGKWNRPRGISRKFTLK